MPIKYLCIDDEHEAEIKSFLDTLSQHVKGLNFMFHNPVEFEDMISLIKDSSPNGLLLDLRLDDRAYNGKKVRYKAMSLAQELRTKMTEDRNFTFPIVLWSVDGNYKKSYNRDKTAHDIFDAVYYKSGKNEHSKKCAEELMYLSKGYEFISKQITQGKVLHKIMGLTSHENLKMLDPRIGGHLSDTKHYPNHIYAHFLLHRFLKHPGPVINEALLAARLGIDITSSKDWNNLLEKKLKEAKYQGAFSKVKPRWWMHVIDQWWNQIQSGNLPLRSLSATERVEIIKGKTKLKNLIAANPIKEGYSDKFWTICHVFRTPLAPQDGAKLIGSKEAWQEPEYASIHAIFERAKSESYTIDPLEKPRIKRLAEAHRHEN